MVAFRIPSDIGNRAAQHCGVPRMDPVLGFADTGSRAAGEISFCYNMMIEAELQRRTWTFATRRQMLRAIDTTTMRIMPSLWSQVTTYLPGSIVADQSGNYWISRIPNNLNNDPLLTTYWEPYFGPLTADPYDTSGDTSYFAGELAYTYSGNGTALVYLSLISGNSDVPGNSPIYDPTVTYYKDQVVTFGVTAYMSLVDLNLNNEPDLAPVLWAVGTTYAAAANVGGSDGIIYQSIGSGNTGNDPTTTTGFWINTGVLNPWIAVLTISAFSPWTATFVGGDGSVNWLLLGGVGLATLDIVYPQGSGPSSQSISSNAFRLPAGFLRQCPQNPKPGLGSLGGPTGVGYNDWLIEGDYIISAESGPISLRFVTNFTDVARMHTQFCEAVAVRIAFAICNSVTQSKALIELIVKTFKEWENDAMIIDGIEDDFVDPPDDDYLTVRQ